MAQRRVSFHTLGCRLNQADSAMLAADMASHGYEVVPWGEEETAWCSVWTGFPGRSAAM